MKNPQGPYLFHATSYNNLKNILKSSAISLHPSHKFDSMLDESSGYIFSHLVFDDIPNYYKHGQLHWVGQCVIELDVQILKQFKFIVCPIGGFEDVKEVYARGRGNLKRLPSLKKVKQVIIDKVNDNAMLGNLAYMHSHEVLFMNDIPISFCRRIIVYDEALYKRIRTFMKKYNTIVVDVLLMPRQAQFDTKLFINELSHTH